MADSIRVQVVHARPGKQWLVALELPHGSSVADAIRCSGLAAEVVDLEVKEGQVGIFYRPCALATVLREGDRVEIYRPLTNDPKEMRRRRAASGRS